jgi:hypothetical protein
MRIRHLWVALVQEPPLPGIDSFPEEMRIACADRANRGALASLVGAASEAAGAGSSVRARQPSERRHLAGVLG